MQPIDFEHRNITYGANQEEYLPLPAYLDRDSAEKPVTTCWKLTWRERIRVLLTGRIYFTQLTFGMALQPQRPSVTFDSQPATQVQ